MHGLATRIEDELSPLVGLQFSIARRAGWMGVLHFGQVRTVPLSASMTKVTGATHGTEGAYALHLQCPWRIDGGDGVITGASDRWEPADQDPGFDREAWDGDEGTLQEAALAGLLGGRDPVTGSPLNTTPDLVVERVEADDYGGVVISLSGGYRLTLFPDGSVGEAWRFFHAHDEDSSHFVISDGQVEDQED